MHTPNDAVTPEGTGRWRIRAERLQGEHAATGEAVVREAGTHHVVLAGARAWLALGRARLAAADAAGTVAAARAGLAELGDQYYARSLGVLNDTSQHIAKADDQIEAGAVVEGAQRLLEVLEQRLKLYGLRHAETLDE